MKVLLVGWFVFLSCFTSLATYLYVTRNQPTTTVMQVIPKLDKTNRPFNDYRW